MRLTKLGHSCVRLEHEGSTLVIDPGGFSEHDAAQGADAIAVTHEHPDHLDLERLRVAAKSRRGVRIHAHPAVASQLGELREQGAEVVEVTQGDAVRMAGFDVDVYGERHAVIHPDLPVINNVGFRVSAAGATLFHPGDAFTIPEDPVGTLLLPIQAPWSKVSEVIDFARAVRPESAIAVHDGLLNENGATVYAKNFEVTLPTVDYSRLLSGEGRDV
ncbi:L-ascorbate metabolism protein UlaG (beta-lactamase superfamily) [Lipingzhangella halophila]|uniref:L-ascorbate metabolism protein UlaG (Beta-lactamase superfamily) n=1 Tax=Lipingzhangella halophila TaxID=1783352 RepID=A0A7W7RHK8_9ACTN|nr:MBL fold metallo-hydrolase [Lipingzhangella halophila]MBB4932124.1 L-ascorbate metabolism protein UlaG (beta-lactamase superfamily) [Lipingzhangella halophila]